MPEAIPRRRRGLGIDTETPLFRKPDLDEMGRDVATPAGADRSLFRRNTLDELTVGRTEKPVTGNVPEKPIITRAKPGVGSCEDPLDQITVEGPDEWEDGSAGALNTSER